MAYTHIDRTKVQIEENTFYEFCSQVQKFVKQGYEFSTENDFFPQNYPGFFFAVLVKPETEESPKETVNKGGRPKKTEV